MSSIAITGITGFLGRHVATHLAREGYKVIGISRNPFPKTTTSDLFVFDPTSVNSSLVQGNKVRSLAEKLLDTKTKTLIHLGAEFLAHHELPEQALSLVNSNIVYGATILEACRLANVKRVICAGTSWQNYKGADYHPVSLYAATREAFETLAAHYALNEQFRIDALHFFDTYGEGDSRKKLLPLLREHFRNCLASHRKTGELPEPMKLGPCTQLINLLHINDAASAVCLAAKAPGEVGHIPMYSIRNHRPISMRDLLKFISELFSSLTGGINLPLDIGKLPGRPREMEQDWNYGAQLGDWSPEIDLETGLKDYFLRTTEKT